MRKAAVRHGDPTTTRGFILAFSSTIHDNGKKVALSGDEATCGNCKGVFKIFGTGQGMSEKNRDVVVDGDRVLCPCGKNRVVVGSNPGIFLKTNGGARGFAATTPVGSPSRNESPGIRAFDRHFQLVDQDGMPIGGALVHLQNPAGEIQEIMTTPEGKTPIMEGRDGDFIKLFLAYIKQ
jgi:hypothetical protein